MVKNPSSQNQLWTHDLLPFEQFAQISPSGMMPSHLSYPASGDSRPATFSPTLLQDWLRAKLGFQGLIFSDDLLMEGAGRPEDFKKNVVQSLAAGVDVVMVSWSGRSQILAIQAVQEALANGHLKNSFLRDKIARIQHIKKIVSSHSSPDSKLSVVRDESRLLISGRLEYGNTVLDILRKVLENSEPLLRTRRPEQIYVFPDNYNFIWQLARATGLVVRPLPAEKSLVKKNDLVIAFAQSRSLAKKIQTWSPQIRLQSLVINQTEPGAFNLNQFPRVVPLYMNHPMVGAELGKSLVKAWDLKMAAY